MIFRLLHLYNHKKMAKLIYETDCKLLRINKHYNMVYKIIRRTGNTQQTIKMKAHRHIEDNEQENAINNS